MACKINKWRKTVNNKQILGLGLTLSFVPLFFIFLFPLLVPRFPFVILVTSAFDVRHVCRPRVYFVNDPVMKALSFPLCTFLSLFETAQTDESTIDLIKCLWVRLQGTLLPW